MTSKETFRDKTHMKSLPKFFFAESSELPGAGFILSSQHPYYLIKVFKFNKPEEFDQFMINSKGAVQVPGYSIAVRYYGTLGDQNENPDFKDVARVAKEAADFYYKDKIEPKLGYYRRYLVQ